MVGSSSEFGDVCEDGETVFRGCGFIVVDGKNRMCWMTSYVWGCVGVDDMVVVYAHNYFVWEICNFFLLKRGCFC